MMKIVSASQMTQLEKQAYEEGFSEEAFMEQAGEGIAKETLYFLKRIEKKANILLLCGKGNNGGDAFVAGRHLLEQGLEVIAIQLVESSLCSPLCQLQEKRFLAAGGIVLCHIPDPFPQNVVILDGLFGTGFRGIIQGPYAILIEAANTSLCPILAIDIPSGLNGSTGAVEGPVIQAKETIFLGLPKIGFFLQDGWNHIGELRYVDFGFPPKLIEAWQAQWELLTLKEVAKLLPPIKRNRHKYQRGHVIGIAGSPGMPGAALLSSLAALRGGSGMVRLLHPDGMQAELANSPYELIKVPYQASQSDQVLEVMQKGNAHFIGPGMGRTPETGRFLKEIVPHLKSPCVIDADALNLLAEGAFELPPKAILTPHTGEMQRLLGQKDPLIVNEELLQRCQNFSDERQVTLILKGAPTFIFHPSCPVWINPRGDPGMAAAGSGDILTGLLAALLGQGLECREAAALGVYLHALAGEKGAQATTSYTMIATDLITHFSAAYQALIEKRLA